MAALQDNRDNNDFEQSSIGYNSSSFTISKSAEKARAYCQHQLEQRLAVNASIMEVAQDNSECSHLKQSFTKPTSTICEYCK